MHRSIFDCSCSSSIYEIVEPLSCYAMQRATGFVVDNNIFLLCNETISFVVKGRQNICCFLVVIEDCGLDALEDENNVDAHKWWYFHGQRYNTCSPLPSKFYHRQVL